MKKTLQILIGFALGGILLYFTLKGKNLTEIASTLSRADIFLTILSSLLMVLIFFLRAARWQLLLKESGAPAPFFNVLSSLGIGYFINSFTPKLGEIVRCTSLLASSQVPLAKSVGVVVSERVYDLVILFSGVFIIFLLEIDRLGHLLAQVYQFCFMLFGSGILWSGLATICFIGILMYIYRARLANIGLIRKILAFLAEIYLSIKSSFSLKQYPLFILYTISIWALLIVLNYVMLQALESTASEGLYFGAIVVFISTIGWALPAPGGIGTSHFLVLQLFLVFGMAEDAGIAFGIYSNGLTFAFTLGFGLLSVIYYYMRARKRLAVS